MGGAVGLAVVNAIAAGFVVDGVSGSATDESLAHGYRVALLVLALLALGGAVLSSTCSLRRAPPSSQRSRSTRRSGRLHDGACRADPPRRS